jgi:hypothetical protein
MFQSALGITEMFCLMLLFSDVLENLFLGTKEDEYRNE